MGTAYFANGNAGNADKFNRVLVSGTTASPGPNTFVWYGRVRYDGANFIVDPTSGSAGIETSMLTWNAGTDELDIDFTSSLDFIQAPIIVVTPWNDDAADNVKAGTTESASEFTGHIAFFNEANGNRRTSESTMMDCNVIIIGVYV